MHVVDHHRRGIHRVGGRSRSLDLECPHVRFWVLARAIPQRQTGQEQHLLLIPHGTEPSNVDTDRIDANLFKKIPSQNLNAFKTVYNTEQLTNVFD